MLADPDVNTAQLRRSQRRRGRRGGRGRARGRRGGRRRCFGGVGAGEVSRRASSGGDGKGGLCVLSLNIRSIKPKILSLRHDLSSFEGDVCVLSETWLKPETPSRYVNFPGYSFTRADRAYGQGFGGVGILTRSGLSFKRLQSVCCSNKCKLETIWLSITTQRRRHFNLCALYRPPCYSITQITADLNCLETQILRIMLTSSAPIFITGDMNYNLLAPNTDCRKMKLLEFLDSLTLHQFVQVPAYRSGYLCVKPC